MTATATPIPAPRRRRLRLLVTFLAVALVSTWALPHVSGFSAAVADHGRGKLTLMRYGEPMLGGDVFHRLMHDRYGVTVQETGCNLVPGEREYIEAYNAYAEWRLRSRFGRDVTAECRAEAMRAGLTARDARQ